MKNSQPKLLIIGYVWPEPDSSAAGRRMMQLIRFFIENGWKVEFASSAVKSRHSVSLDELGMKTKSIKVNDSSFDYYIAGLKPDVVLFDRFVTEEQFGWRVREQCPKALTVLDSEDLHCLRRSRKKALKEGKDFTEEMLLTSEDSFREIASIYRCDLSLIISTAEIALLENLFGVESTMLHYLPFLEKQITKEQIKQWKSFEERAHFVSIGNFRHPPNRDAVAFLNSKIWPEIRERLPKAEVHIYGAYASSGDQQLNDPQKGFLIKGRATSAKEVVENARLLLAPLRFGAGLKGKLLEAMTCGTPSVTTPIGAEGIRDEKLWCGAVANNTDKFVEAAVNLYQNKEKWMSVRENGIEIFNSRFTSKKPYRKLLKKINQRLNNLETFRQKNFTGAMLRHHSMNAAKFMSKWIQEKNKEC